ncbi:MAG: esterase [Pyrinomonadaceae bacterium]|nr:esterase [Pyrinomonadaceae bacterium]
MSENKGTIKVLQHESNVLKSNPLGDPHTRELYVYLPPGYDMGDKNYPVAYCLTGFTGRGKMMLNDSAFSPNMAERLDKLIESGTMKPMIVVMPDCFTRYGGSQYLNSSATGNYEDYLTKEIVPFIDENFRTIDSRESRAITGKSSGGYGAMIMAMRHAELFGLATTIAGDCYFELCYKPDFRKALKAINGDPLKLVEKFYDEESKKGKFAFDGLNTIGMASCYSPNPASEWGFDIPFDLGTGEIREDVWQEWLKNDPVYLLEESAENLKTLRLFFIDAGTSDEFALDLGARVLVDRLKKHDIPHVHEEFDGGHFNINFRYKRTFELISENILDEST